MPSSVTVTKLAADEACIQARAMAVEAGIDYDVPNQDYQRNGQPLIDIRQNLVNEDIGRHLSECPICNQIKESQFDSLVNTRLWVHRYQQEQEQHQGTATYWAEQVEDIKQKIAGLEAQLVHATTQQRIAESAAAEMQGFKVRHEKLLTENRF